MKTVASYSTPAEAQVAWSRLTSAGVEAMIRDELTVGSMWVYSNAIGGVKIEVIEEDYDTARELLGLAPSDEGAIRCPHCGAADCHVRVLDVWGAICVVLKLPIPLQTAVVDCRKCGKSHSVPINGDGTG